MFSFLIRFFILSVAINLVDQKSIQDNSLLNRIESLENIVDRIINKTGNLNQDSKDHVIFYARLTTLKTLNTYSIIQFDNVVTNVGGHYNPGDGIFVAPASGVYFFTWTMLNYNGNAVFTELRVENVVKGSSVVSTGSNLYAPGSTSVACHVNDGDHVWVQTSGGTSTNYIYNWGQSSSFLGFIIQKD